MAAPGCLLSTAHWPNARYVASPVEILASNMNSSTIDIVSSNCFVFTSTCKLRNWNLSKQAMKEIKSISKWMIFYESRDMRTGSWVSESRWKRTSVEAKDNAPASMRYCLRILARRLRLRRLSVRASVSWPSIRICASAYVIAALDKITVLANRVFNTFGPRAIFDRINQLLR